MTYVIVATFEYENPEDRTKVLPNLLAHRDRCLRDEPGTLTFELSTANDDDKKLMLYETYESREAFDAHWNGPSIKQVQEENSALGIKFSLSAVHCTRVD